MTNAPLRNPSPVIQYRPVGKLPVVLILAPNAPASPNRAKAKPVAVNRPRERFGIQSSLIVMEGVFKAVAVSLSLFLGAGTVARA